MESLNSFTYPQEFQNLKKVIASLLADGVYNDSSLHIELFVGDAREYVLGFKENMFDIIYQDAFSPSTNPILWTQEYFKDIARIMKKDAVVTTYSIALSTRLALYENSLNIYIHSGEGFRDSTIASLSKLEGFKEVDMKHKISCNPEVKSLRD